MSPIDSLSCLSDGELLAHVQRLTARSNVALAELLAHLGEVEGRGIHRTRACASLYTYCIYELRMSEDAAFRRSKAARLVREHPELRHAIARGELHLTGVLIIGPHLGGEQHAEILRRARFRSKRELLRLVAEIDPKPEVPARVTPIGPAPAGSATHRGYMEALAGQYRELPRGQRPEDWMADDADADERAETTLGRFSVAKDTEGGEGAATHPARTEDEGAHTEGPPVTSEPSRPLRYHVEFTASQEHVDLLNEVTDLLGHERPRPPLPEIHLRALRALARELRTKKRAATGRPRKGLEQDKAAPRSNEGSLAGPAFDASTKAPAPARGVSDAKVAHTAPVQVVVLDDGGRIQRGPSGTAVGAHPRYVRAAVRRAVWDRDEACCAYVDERGVRCRETGGLELHHRRAHALGGPPTTVNLELRCIAHNTLAAERDFGREHVDWVRGVARGQHRPPEQHRPRA